MHSPENHVGICRLKLNNGKLKFKIKKDYKDKGMVINNNNHYPKPIKLNGNLWLFSRTNSLM
jgi:hypothetical protein